jgi:hypothetical protein
MTKNLPISHHFFFSSPFCKKKIFNNLLSWKGIPLKFKGFWITVTDKQRNAKSQVGHEVLYLYKNRKKGTREFFKWNQIQTQFLNKVIYSWSRFFQSRNTLIKPQHFHLLLGIRRTRCWKSGVDCYPRRTSFTKRNWGPSGFDTLVRFRVSPTATGSQSQ